LCGLGRRRLNHRSGSPNFPAYFLNFHFENLIVYLDLEPTHGFLLLMEREMIYDLTSDDPESLLDISKEHPAAT
jgi:hypothetical protein